MRARSVKALVAAIIMAGATALFVYGTYAPLFFINTPNGVVVSLWEICFRKDGKVDETSCKNLRKFDCEEQSDKFSSARAFIIITTIASAVAAWFALLEVFKYKTTKWRVVFCLMTFISGVISWAICLSLFTTKQCDLFGTSLEEFQDAKLGDNFPACFVAWLFTTCAIALEFVNQSIYRCCDKDSSSSTSGSKDHHHQDYSRRHHSRDRRRHHRGGSRRSNSRR